MEKDLSYLNDQGNTVFTSYFLRNRKSCCKTGCLHCPYGFTLKKFGLKFLSVDESNRDLVDAILMQNSSNFDYSSFWSENVKVIQIKDAVCGVLFKNHIVIKQLFLLPHFQNQGLTKEIVESYYFI